jgi:hypothetical protein
LTAAEERIQRKDLPPKVEQAVQAQSGGATIRGFTQETEHGKTLYEAEMIVDCHGKDVSFDSAGVMVSVGEEISLESLRAAQTRVISVRDFIWAIPPDLLSRTNREQRMNSNVGMKTPC